MRNLVLVEPNALSLRISCYISLGYVDIVIPRLLRGYNIALSTEQTPTRRHLRQAQFYSQPILFSSTKMYKFRRSVLQRILETKAKNAVQLSPSHIHIRNGYKKKYIRTRSIIRAQ